MMQTGSGRPRSWRAKEPKRLPNSNPEADRKE
jgi:hypothetical protein